MVGLDFRRFFHEEKIISESFPLNGELNALNYSLELQVNLLNNASRLSMLTLKFEHLDEITRKKMVQYGRDISLLFAI